MGCDTMIAASQQVHIGQRQPKRQVNDIHGQWSLQKRWNIADVQGMNINQLSWMKHVQNLGLFSEVFQSETWIPCINRVKRGAYDVLRFPVRHVL